LDLSKAISRKRSKIGSKLVLITNRKSHMSFRLVPKSVTLNVVEWRNGSYFALFQQIRVASVAHCIKVHVRYLISWWVLVKSEQLIKKVCYYSFSALMLLVGQQEGIQSVKIDGWGAGTGICLWWGADLHMAQLMPLPPTVSCLSEIQIGFTFLVPANLGSSRQRAVKWLLLL